MNDVAAFSSFSAKRCLLFFPSKEAASLSVAKNTKLLTVTEGTVNDDMYGFTQLV